MKKTRSQLELNTTASFAYVKKDILMLNDAFSDLFDKMQKLIGRVEKLEAAAGKKKVVKKKVVKKRR
ncbi:hypothetical protein HN747_04350 [archaeon]|nr:hypothetical protein [archaeon]